MYWEGAAEAKLQADLISTILQIHTPRCSEPHPSTGEEKAKKVASNTAWLCECAETDLHSGPFNPVAAPSGQRQPLNRKQKIPEHKRASFKLHSVLSSIMKPHVISPHPSWAMKFIAVLRVPTPYDTHKAYTIPFPSSLCGH